MIHEAQPGSIVDERYETKRIIARGGMAAVFEAVHVRSGLRVALKVLHADSLRSDEARQRLLREATALGSLRHPNVVQIYDAGECPQHGPYLSLEMIEGRPLDGILVARRRLPTDQSVAVLVQLCEALDEVHRRGLVHRDVKPSNLLISRTPIGDRVELIDFGIAKLGDTSQPKLTRAGDMLGTLDYMSPEQLLGDQLIDSRTDVYAAAVLLYECLTGEVPFAGPPTTLVARIVSGAKPEPLASRGVDVPALDAVIARALEMDVDARFATPRELALATLAAVGDVAELSLLDVPTGGMSIVQEHRARSRQNAAEARRQYARAPYVTPARIAVGDRTIDGRTEDISEGGLLVVTEGELAAGTVVQVRFSLPTSGRVVQVAATAQWAKSHRNLRALGLRFEDPPDELQADVRRYVEIVGVKR